MNDKQLKQYEPMIVVELKNGRKLITPARFRDNIEKRWNLRQINYIEGVTVDGYGIELIEPLSSEYDMLIGLNEDQRSRAEARFREYEQNLGRKPEREAKLKIIQKIINK